ncbi:DgyrCDS12051 [Dimorphilus gyrociliatus]|uniref:beta-N-acetylhexosaminidase n=1 Tax=Dimorphilus gyrociliatus TaxID=2664684 RepID=A0A7I8W669_9ANNE|nr:DgyrCDS12051 [Dimorphilus gyrociliatus]
MAINCHRIVHLDLKGAPPKISYIVQILPLLKEWGCTGLLMEYEDTFPYFDNLKFLSNSEAYTKENVEQILAEAKKLHLEVIPLIQTFGHLEFALKHDNLKCLREVPNYPMSLCPSNSESCEFLYEIINQILSLHPNAKWLHIGADEVSNIGYCGKCRKRRIPKEELFLGHVENIAKFVKKKNIQPIIWDDILRNVPQETLLTFNLSKMVDIMVWDYRKELKFPDEMWEKYSKAFENLWIATAFKGATGPCKYATDIKYHIANHRAWLKLLPMLKEKFKNVQGVVTTGWSRYDHYAILCELLPVGFPSLAISLNLLNTGSFSENLHTKVSNDLKFKSTLPLVPFTLKDLDVECSFPGSNIYRGTLKYLKLREEIKKLEKHERIRGWMSTYHIKRKFANPAHLSSFLPNVKYTLNEVENFRCEMQNHLIEVFGNETVSEFLETLLDDKIMFLKRLVNDCESLMQIGAGLKSNSE